MHGLKWPINSTRIVDLIRGFVSWRTTTSLQARGEFCRIGSGGVCRVHESHYKVTVLRGIEQYRNIFGIHVRGRASVNRKLVKIQYTVHDIMI